MNRRFAFWEIVLLIGCLGLLLWLSLRLSLFGIVNLFWIIKIELSDIVIWLLTGLIMLTALGAVFNRYRQRQDSQFEKIKNEWLQIERDERKDFLRLFDHELKNPLTIIGTYLESLQEDPLSEAERTAKLSLLATQVGRLNKIVHHVQKLAELETGKIEQVPVDLKDVLQQAYELSAEPIVGKQDKVRLDIQEKPWRLEVWGNRDLLILAFRNLINNAQKYTAPAGQVEVRAIGEQHFAIIQITDTGIGISPQEQRKIFQRDYRSQAVQGQIPGSGFGSYFAQRVVALHNGQLIIHSRPQEGTIIVVRLPLTDDGP